MTPQKQIGPLAMGGGYFPGQRQFRRIWLAVAAVPPRLRKI